MKATIDISLYPLNNDFRNYIKSFVLNLREVHDIEVVTDGMSTKLIGDYDLLLHLLQKEMKNVLEETKAVFIIKLARGERRGTSLFDEK